LHIKDLKIPQINQINLNILPNIIKIYFGGLTFVARNPLVDSGA